MIAIAVIYLGARRRAAAAETAMKERPVVELAAQIFSGRGRLLAALAMLAGLLTGAAAALHQANAQIPGDVALELSIIEDTDNIVRAGTTIQVRAAVTNSGFPRDLNLRKGSLRLLGGALEWESTGRAALSITDQQTSSGAFGLVGAPDGAGFGSGAMDKRTLAVSGARIENIGGIGQGFVQSAALRVYNSATGALIGSISPPSAAQINANNEAAAPDATEGAAAVAFAYSNSLAVWEDAANDEAWLFVGSMEDTVDGITRSGRLYIYKVALDTGAITLERSLEPTKVLLENDIDTETPRGDIDPQPEHVKALYGSAVRVSADGSTLAVAAYNMNDIGRVWIYEKPSGAGEDWGDLEWTDGLSITAIPVPTWRGGAGHTWFTWQNGKRVATTHCFPWITDPNHPGWGPTCTADQRKDYAYIHSYFGKNSITLSHDGSTLIVVAAQKSRADDWTVWGDTKIFFPEAYVFAKPGANWTAMTAPTAILNAASYANTPANGEIFTGAAISRDGNTIAIGAPGVYQSPHTVGRVMLWTKPNTGWASKVGPDATLTNPGGRPGDGFGRWVSFNGYASGTTSALLVQDPTWQDADPPAGMGANTAASYYGRSWIFTAPAGGWNSATTRSATQLVSPQPRAGGFFSAGYAVGWDTTASSAIDLIHAHQREFHPSYPAAPVAGSGRFWLLNPTNNQPLAFNRFGGPCDVETMNSESDSSCALYIADSRIVLPTGLANGMTLTISGSVTLSDGTAERTLTDTLTITVGDVDETVTGEFALSRRTDGSSFPATIVAGRTTEATLKLLTQNGMAAPRGSVSSVFFVTSAGTLTAEIGDADTTSDCTQAAASVCSIASAPTALTSATSDNIRLTIAHPGPGKSGVARVQATVITTAGETLRLEPLRVIFAGDAASLSISKPTAAILNADTPDPGTAGTDPVNNQDVLTLTVSSADASGNQAALPTSRYQATIKDPDGRAVATTGSNARMRVDWPLRRDGPDDGTDVSADDPLDLKDGSPQARIYVDAPAANKLATGEYTLELRAGSLSASRAFNVVGGPAAIGLTLDPGLQINVDQTVTVTARVTDEQGAPVPDGTEVAFSEQSVGTGAVLILRTQSRQTTTDGEATAMLLAVSPGSGYVIAAADGIREVRVITAVSSRAPVSLDEQLTSTKPNDYSVWAGDDATRASDLLPRLTDVTTILLWTGESWIRYAVVGGRLIPGSMDFEIQTGNILYLANGGS